MRSEQHEALIRMGTHRFVRNMLRSMTVLLTIPFVIFFSVWGSLEGKYTTDWVMSPLTIVVGIVFSVITLIIARIYYKRDVTAIFESFAEPVPTDSRTPPYQSNLLMSGDVRSFQIRVLVLARLNN